jgi:hypothetical protein
MDEESPLRTESFTFEGIWMFPAALETWPRMMSLIDAMVLVF